MAEDENIEEKDTELEGIEEDDEENFDYKIRVYTGRIIYTLLDIIRSPFRIMIAIGKGIIYGFRKIISKKFRIIANWTEAIKTHPDDITLYIKRAEAYIKMKKLKKAFDDYTQIINLDSNNADAYEKRGDIYRQWGKEKEANIERDKARQLRES